MRAPLYDTAARKRTVSLTINSDLYTRARAAGLNASNLAEQALAEALRAREREQILKDIAFERAALAAYVAEHGDPVQELSELYGGWADDRAEPGDAA